MKEFPLPSRPAPSGGERPPPFAKGEEPQEASYANGGQVLGRTRDFIKESDGKDQKNGGNKVYKNPDYAESAYAKSGKASGRGQNGGAPPAHGKSLPVVKPRK